MKKLFLLTAVCLLMYQTKAQAIPSQITYQGTLRQNGVPANGTIKMEFKIINGDDSITYWNSQTLPVVVTQGLFSQLLTPQNTLNPENPLDWGNTTPYIQVIINPDTTPVTLAPIEPITTTMFSLVAGTVLDGSITPKKLSNSVATIPTGTILPFAGSSVPPGYFLCDGSQISRATYGTLFLAIGTVWGAGDGILTFNLPDLRGRTLIGSGHGNGLTNRNLADTVGEEAHALSIGEMPIHNHGINDPGHAHGPFVNGQTYVVEDPGSPQNMASSGGTAVRAVQQTGTATTGITIQNAGGGISHNIMQPSIAVNYIIKD